MTYTVRRLSGLTFTILLLVAGCSNPDFDSATMKKQSERLREANAFQFPLDNFFPDIPVTQTKPPKGEAYHAAEDCFAPAGTPVYAIGDGVIRYSGKARGYGWLIIVDHPAQNVYSLYGHLSTRRWKKEEGPVKKGELIAYLAVAEEGETMVSHIHFGMRLGQKADYWKWGDSRWMAGYTSRPPERFGWFRPSEIIGQTDSIRTWHRYLNRREAKATGRTLTVSDFRITGQKYNEMEDLDRVVEKEFGDQYRLADWNDILTFKDGIEDWVNDLGLEAGEENSLLIANDGYRIWLGRQYYLSRFNGNKPRLYLAHDNIDAHYVCLGSWSGLSMRVLAVKK